GRIEADDLLLPTVVRLMPVGAEAEAGAESGQPFPSQVESSAGGQAGDGRFDDVEAVCILAEHPAFHDGLPDAAESLKGVADLPVQLSDELAAVYAHQLPGPAHRQSGDIQGVMQTFGL